MDTLETIAQRRAEKERENAKRQVCFEKNVKFEKVLQSGDYDTVSTLKCRRHLLKGDVSM